MALHFRGLQVPPLGSPRDLTFRKYLTHETRVEAKKQELLTLIAMASPIFSEDSKRKQWIEAVQKTHSDFVSLSQGFEPKTEVEQYKVYEEQELLKFYEEQVKTSSPKISKNKQGTLEAVGLPASVQADVKAYKKDLERQAALDKLARPGAAPG